MRLTGLACAGISLLFLGTGSSAWAQAPASTCPNPNSSNTTSVCPQLSGSVQEARVVSATTGQWTGSQPLGFAFRWQRCTSASADSCSDIPGENESQHLLDEADTGNRVRVVVTAANAEGSASRTSTITATVAPSPTYPGSNQTFAPALEGIAPAALPAPLTGDTLRVAVGSGPPMPTSDGWFNPPAASHSFAWRRCAPGGALAGCATIAGATSRTYTLTNADAGHSLRARVTGTSANGSKALLTPPSGAVAFADRDGDGVASNSDCDDSNPAVRPGALDAPANGVDEDCNGSDAAPLVDLTAPVISALALSPSAFRAGTRGTRVGYRLSEPATVTVKVERALVGIRRSGRCVRPPRPAPRRAKRCTRHAELKGGATRAGVEGANAFRFGGRLRGKALAPGSYRLLLTAVDAAGNGSARPATRKFRVLRGSR